MSLNMMFLHFNARRLWIFSFFCVTFHAFQTQFRKSQILNGISSVYIYILFTIKINQMYIDVGNYTSFMDSMALLLFFGRSDPRICFEDAKENRFQSRQNKTTHVWYRTVLVEAQVFIPTQENTKDSRGLRKNQQKSQNIPTALLFVCACLFGESRWSKQERTPFFARILGVRIWLSDFCFMEQGS